MILFVEQGIDLIQLLKKSTFQGGASFVDGFCYSCFVFVMLSCLSIAAL